MRRSISADAAAILFGAAVVIGAAMYAHAALRLW